MLIRDSTLRGGTFYSRQIVDMPLISQNPLSLARALPGATESFGSTVWSAGYASNGNAASVANSDGAGFSFYGLRPSGNNYLLVGTENNECWISGEQQVFTIADAVQDVSVQTGNFGVEFGRAGGGVFNVITKSGTNQLHGTLLWRYQSELFDSVSNYNKLNGIPRSVFSNNIFGFTAGGPIRRNKTFFFAGFEQNNTHSTANYAMQIPTAGAVSQLISLFPGNPQLALYLDALGTLRGTANLFPVQLGNDPATGVNRGVVQFGSAAYVLPSINDGPQWLARVDRVASARQHLSGRLAYDSRVINPDSVTFPGFFRYNAFENLNFLFSDSYVFSSTYTNELRLSYERPDARLDVIPPPSSPGMPTVPTIQITNVSAPGPGPGPAAANAHLGNDFIVQETQTKVSGHHVLRYGLQLLEERIKEQQGGGAFGTVTFNASPSQGYSAFANFLDDFSGPSGVAMRSFGSAVFYPNQLQQGYFFQDSWRPTPTLALTLGLRYDNFGQFANSLAYPAFPGFDPRQFLVRHTVSPDNKDFGPSFGLAWSPSGRSSWIARALGGGKTVWRGGFQISYDSLPTQLIALGPSTTAPNSVTDTNTAPSTGRGNANWYQMLPQLADVPTVADTQNPIAGNLRNPYTERWSFGFQRELPANLFLDVSYIGSESHRLTTRADWNPRLPTGLRLYPLYGVVVAKTSEGNSTYDALQALFSRRFKHGFEFSTAYTWSKMMDSTSDGVGNANIEEPSGGNLTSVPVMYGGMKLDRAVSDFDRPQRLSISYLWSLPGPRKGWSRNAFGGWQLAGMTVFQSGTPFSIANGFDRDNFGDKEDRADIANPKMPLNTRAVIFPACSTGYQDPDTFACVTPQQVHWIEGSGFPNASTVGRNTMRTVGTNNWDLNLTKAIRLGETRRLELRWEALNAFNHPQWVNVPPDSIVNSAPGRFLNRNFTDAGIRNMWAQVKFVF